MSRIALLLLVATASLGCVERRLLITSEPSGALVHLNDQEIGRTPLDVPFRWYGVYDVKLQQDGYQTLHTQEEAEQPWWEYPGPDLVAEAVPGKKVEVSWHFKLQPSVPASEVDPDRMLDFADQLRALNNRDSFNPDPETLVD